MYFGVSFLLVVPLHSNLLTVNTSNTLLTFILICLINFGSAQDITQVVKGVVTDAFTGSPIPDVHVDLRIEDSIVKRTITNTKGEYRFEEVELNIYDITFSHIAYKPLLIADVTVYSRTESVVNAHLEFVSHVIDETTIVAPEKERGVTNNRMATVSAYSIRAKDARRLAGALDDPIRAAGTLPGVTPNAAFSENFISIRGNSPRGLKYIMNGAEIPNPTHFARIGSSGGTFTIFSMQMLDNSDFFSGAFPAEYGNALAGVFDVRFRTGNTDKREYTFQIGTLGIDFSAEGPMDKAKKKSFLVNYRYATVGTARLIGYPTEPTYQDLSFNLNFPLKKGGNLNVFSIMGTSDRKRIAERDSSLWKKDVDRLNLNLHSDMLTFGTNYSRLIGEKSVFNLMAMISGTDQTDDKKYITDEYTELTKSINEYTSLPISLSTYFKRQFNTKHSNKTGASLVSTRHDWTAEKYNYTTSKLDTIVQGKGTSLTVQAYTQSKYVWNKKWTGIFGIHYLYYNVNNQQSIEPRTGITYTINPKNQLAFGYGLHSQIENYAIYRFQQKDSLGNISYPNQNLNFAKANHFVLSYKTKIIPNHNLKIEVYYQYLYDVPTEANGSYSVVNIGELSDIRPLTNQGEAINQGIDIGLERYTNDGLYYMINSSIFQSTYQGGDGVWRHSQYDYGYNVRFLAGKDYIIGEKKNKKNYVGWNTNVAMVGGAPYTPIDLTNSRLQQETVLDESKAFSKKGKDLLFVDVTLTYKINKHKHTSIWTLQIKNLFSNGNALYREYDSVLDKAVTIPSSSFFPNLSYKVQF